jgi:glycosyltransferase involved in cell wall biosynthesis
VGVTVNQWVRPLKVTVGIPTYNRAEWLRESITSVLTQSYRDFRLLISDNASDDATDEVVASFDDSRIEYVRASRNAGFISNFNRIIELAGNEFLTILPDDDIMYPEYLSATVPLLESHKSVGVLHTGHKLIDEESRVVATNRLPTDEPVTFEEGEAYLERSMSSAFGTICWTSALFRTEAIQRAEGLRATEQPFADVPLFMRIALHWDVLSVSDALVGVRVHERSETAAAVGSFTGADYEMSRLPKVLFDRRIQFLDDARTNGVETGRYRELAERSLRTDSVHGLANRSGAGAPWKWTMSELIHLVKKDRRTLLVPSTWRLAAAQLGGRQAKKLVMRTRLRTRGNPDDC